MNARAKGKNGEREFERWLKDNLDLDAKRNLSQSRDGGTDIELENFCIEVKRQEKLDLEGFWSQAKKAAQDLGKRPIVAFRQNNRKWQFLIEPTAIGCENGFVQLKEITFIEWFKRETRHCG